MSKTKVMAPRKPTSPTLFELVPLPPPPAGQVTPMAVYSQDPLTGQEEFLGVRGGVQVPISRFREYLDTYELVVDQVLQMPDAATLIVVRPKDGSHVGAVTSAA